MNEPVIGIDLGTTNSEVAVWLDGRIEIVEEDGDPILPSCVGLDGEGRLLVGHEALNQYLLQPDRTCRSVKRLMGSEEKVLLGQKQYLPQEISAIILRRLKERAEQRLGCPVNKAVITVPAQFSDAQRQATRDAGAIAGLEVLRIINEPTAASLAYLDDRPNRAATVLTFDLGGGTFDVSIVRMEGEVVEVLASHGDTRLGGDDMDRLIADWIAGELYSEENRPETLPPRLINRLDRSAERAKRQLSDAPHARIIETGLTAEGGGAEAIDIELHRPEFAELIAPLVNTMLVSVHQALADAGLHRGRIDQILLVGGATRVQAVQDALEQELGQRPRSDLHPDLAVAYGAGILAARLMGEEQHRVLVDITPYTFGTAAMGMLNDDFSPHCFVPIIKSGSPLPVSKGEAFATFSDNQKEVDVTIYQGENQDARRNILIGRFRVKGLSPVPAGNEIIISMQLDLDGILHVTAIEKMSGLSKQVRVEDALAKMTDQDVATARRRIEEQLGIEAQQPPDQTIDDGEPQKAGLETAAGSLTKRIGNSLGRMDDVDREDAERLVERLEEALADNRQEDAQKILIGLEDILFYIEAH